MGKKLWRHVTFSSTCSCYYKKHPKNDNKICPLPLSSCFLQHFHDWLYLLRYNSDLSKLEWTLLLFNLSCIHDLTNSHNHYLLAPNSTFMTDSLYLGTIQTCQNLNEHCYCLISTASMIRQIDPNCSPFQSLCILPFHIKLEHLKLINQV